jgi:hypothetical protein
MKQTIPFNPVRAGEENVVDRMLLALYIIVGLRCGSRLAWINQPEREKMLPLQGWSIYSTTREREPC